MDGARERRERPVVPTAASLIRGQAQGVSEGTDLGIPPPGGRAGPAAQVKVGGAAGARGPSLPSLRFSPSSGSPVAQPGEESDGPGEQSIADGQSWGHLRLAVRSFKQEQSPFDFFQSPLAAQVHITQAGSRHSGTREKTQKHRLGFYC